MLTLNVVNPDKCHSDPKSSSIIPSISKRKISKYTLDIFLVRAQDVHGNKYDYSLVKPEHIKGVKSHIPITCNECGYQWNPCIDAHINRRTGCPECAGNAPWTYDRFIKSAVNIHGDKFNYSCVTPEMIIGKDSAVSIICNECGYQWNVTIHNHITGQRGCPSCSGHIPWTYERFKIDSIKVHGDKFDYSMITPEMITGVTARISIKCNTCDHQWSPTIYGHIHCKNGCPSCSHRIPWTYDRFVEAIHNIHGSKYNYDKVDPKAILRKDTRVELRCNECGYEWNPVIDVLINQGSGCPDCAGNAPWTYERFIKHANDTHGDKYDYSMVTPSDINNKKSRIQLICNECNYSWESSVDNHINGRRGCRNCSNRLPWNYESFIECSKRIHGFRFDYSEVNPNDIKNGSSYISVICNNCHKSWVTSVTNHINGKYGCSICRQSKGEKECADVLTTLSIQFLIEMSIEAVPNKRYDFMFNYNGESYLLEYDGKQHFEPNDHFDRDIKTFEDRQKCDIIKTSGALNSGYKIIRIDYTKLGSIRQEIITALNSNMCMYLSDPDKYSYITRNIDLRPN